MKKSAFLILLIFLGFSFEQLPVTDYRDAYVGSYFCSRLCQVLNSDHTSLMNVTDTITISVSKDPLDSIVRINIGMSFYQFKLNSGVMTSYPLGGQRSGKFYSLDSIGLGIIAGLSPSTCFYKGKKN